MLKELKTQHRQILRLKSQGLKITEIANRVGMKYGSVAAILRDPMAKSFLDGLQDQADEEYLDVTRKLAELQTDALTVMKDALTLPEVGWKDRIVVARDVLDRNGHKAPEKHLHAHGHFTKDDLLKLQERAALAEDPNVINAETVH